MCGHAIGMLANCLDQVIFVAIPLVVVLRDITTDGRYIGLLVLLWSMPMSTILLIMLPKVVAHYKGAQGMSHSERVRGSSVGVRVTGVPGSTAESANRASVGSRRASDERRRTSSESPNEFAED